MSSLDWLQNKQKYIRFQNRKKIEVGPFSRTCGQMLLSRNFEISTNNRKGLYSQSSRRNSSRHARTVSLVCHAHFSARKLLASGSVTRTRNSPPNAKVLPIAFFRARLRLRYTRAAYICAYTRQPSRRNSSYPARTVPLVCHARFAVERAARKRLGHPYGFFTPATKALSLPFFRVRPRLRLNARGGHEKRHLTVSFVVGLNRLELSTSRLSGACSNQLSYNPEFYSLAGVVEMHGFEPRTS